MEKPLCLENDAGDGDYGLQRVGQGDGGEKGAVQGRAEGCCVEEGCMEGHGGWMKQF